MEEEGLNVGNRTLPIMKFWLAINCLTSNCKKQFNAAPLPPPLQISSTAQLMQAV